MAKEIATWLAARGRKPGILAPGGNYGGLVAADAVVIVNADGQGSCNGGLLQGLRALPAGALAGKPVLPVVHRVARDSGAVHGPLGPLLQDLGAALVLNPVALERWDCQFPSPEAIGLLEGLLALEQAAAFCRRLAADRRAWRENLELSARFAGAPMLA